MHGASIVSLNVERDMHLDKVLPFLKRKTPDIFCVQELCEQDIPLFKELFEYHVYAPMALRARINGSLDAFGVGIFSRDPITASSTPYYVGDGAVVEADGSDMESKQNTIQHPLVTCDIQKDGIMYRICSTHFPWTPDGSASDFQREALTRMMALLDEKGELVCCGDFNAPRGQEIFTALSNKFKDNIPTRYTTSIDGALHRAGPLPLMVDGLFSTKDYEVSDVTLESGVSDHCALVGKIEKIV